ncbi:hypothetical protein H2O73_14520 [Vibrio sp. 404]|uniref:Cation transporter n=1 Tax=Vibrio marinisediminis TaxID=2758441 RepID=A0A7W2FSQ8_9VIBR|nr:hypothetical protein [Vibrio marinisediminis]MBA5763574.1 hypothetical protein [Vibrio marinisediminis]
MKRDVFGICLSKSMLSQNLSSTFTHVRAYSRSELIEDAQVRHAYPQISGQDLLNNMQTDKSLFWRAEYVCRIGK